jgi:hypothetical protein
MSRDRSRIRYEEKKTMTSLAKPSRRTLMKWGVASAGMPLVSQALGPVAEGKSKLEDNNERGGPVVSLRPGLQMFYRMKVRRAVA